MSTHVPPKLDAQKFTCRLCGTLATQTWLSISLGRQGVVMPGHSMCRCTACNGYSLWTRLSESLDPDPWAIDRGWQIWPLKGGAAPHDDMPAAAQKPYEQARAVLGASPAAAAALLRVATEALVHHLLQDDSVMLNVGIGRLVAEGRISGDVARACDVLRVTGNDVLHPGQIDLNDDRSEVAERLFNLVNVIVQRAITEPAEIAALFAEIPETKRDAIARRDAPPKE